MTSREIVREVQKKKTEGTNILSAGPADGWHDLLCRLSRDGSNPDPRRLGRYLTKNAGRFAGDLQLLSELDTQQRSTGIASNLSKMIEVRGISGVSRSPSSYAHTKCDLHDNLCEEDASHNKCDANRPSETPQTPGTYRPTEPWASVRIVRTSSRRAAGSRRRGS
jgi:hypothetical protein